MEIDNGIQGGWRGNDDDDDDNDVNDDVHDKRIRKNEKSKCR